MWMRRYSGFITARWTASVLGTSIRGLIWLGNMAEGGNAGSTSSAVSQDSNRPVNKSLPSGISPFRIRKFIAVIAIDIDPHMAASLS